MLSESKAVYKFLDPIKLQCLINKLCFNWTSYYIYLFFDDRIQHFVNTAAVTTTMFSFHGITMANLRYLMTKNSLNFEDIGKS